VFESCIRFEIRTTARKLTAQPFFPFTFSDLKWDFLTRIDLLLPAHLSALSLALAPALTSSQSLTMSSAQQRLAAVSSSLSHPKGLLAGEVAIITGVSTLYT